MVSELLLPLHLPHALILGIMYVGTLSQSVIAVFVRLLRQADSQDASIGYSCSETALLEIDQTGWHSAT